MIPEFHRPVAVERLPAGGSDHAVEASAEECAALARRMGLPALLALSCRFRLTPAARRSVLAEGVLAARVTQLCVVSLDAFDADVSERFRLRFVPEGELQEDDDPDSDDEVAITGGMVDLGEAAAEQLALALDPYPRKPGSAAPDPDAAAPLSPFAALARLRRPED